VGIEANDRGGSFYNKKEAEFVGCLIDRLLQDGIDARNIGVVTLYKSQQSKIYEILMTARFV
jgi:superfamily I DNA and/or RNA helicase